MSAPIVAGVKPLDVLDIYLTEVRHRNRVPYDEEPGLLQAVIRARSAQRQLAEATSPDEYTSLQAVIDRGHIAREQLAKQFLGLVIKIAKTYRGCGVDFPDLIQEGNIGLLWAIDTYDPAQLSPLVAVICGKVRDTIREMLIRRGNLVRQPHHVYHLRRAINAILPALEEHLGRTPRVTEIAAAVSASPQMVQSILTATQPPRSLDQPRKHGGDGAQTLGDIIAAPHDTEAVALTHALIATLHNALEQLTPRQREVVDLVVGLTDQTPRTFAEVARQSGCSKSVPHETYRTAITKLRFLILGPDSDTITSVKKVRQSTDTTVYVQRVRYSLRLTIRDHQYDRMGQPQAVTVTAAQPTLRVEAAPDGGQRVSIRKGGGQVSVAITSIARQRGMEVGYYAASMEGRTLCVGAYLGSP